MSKLKIGFYWASTCGGCEVAVLDINEKILDALKVADIVFWPVAMDVKYKDIEAMDDKGVDVCFFNGSIRNEENEHLAKLLRGKARILISFGSCACSGGVPGLANLHKRRTVFEKVYGESVSTKNPHNLFPTTRFEVKEGKLTLPEFYDTVKTLDQVVNVDFYLPGCPPPVDLIINALQSFASGKYPKKGSVLAPDVSICESCKRVKGNKNIANLVRFHETTLDPKKCFLDQGIICMGPATRSGCGEPCLNANMPCSGCMGPTPGASDQGAAMIGALSSILGIENETELSEKDMDRLVDQIKDPVGTFYKYTLPSSVINRSAKG
jgi:F420-non-reducing hydrogenase small subunit